jgi:hypothetical protein
MQDARASHTFVGQCLSNRNSRAKEPASAAFFASQIRWMKYEMGLKAETAAIDQYTPYIAASEGDLNLLKEALVTLGVPLSLKDEGG